MNSQQNINKRCDCYPSSCITAAPCPHGSRAMRYRAAMGMVRPSVRLAAPYSRAGCACTPRADVCHRAGGRRRRRRRRTGPGREVAVVALSARVRRAPAAAEAAPGRRERGLICRRPQTGLSWWSADKSKVPAGIARAGAALRCRSGSGGVYVAVSCGRSGCGPVAESPREAGGDPRETAPAAGQGRHVASAHYTCETSAVVLPSSAMCISLRGIPQL